MPIAYFKPDTVGCTPLTVQFRNLSVHGESYLWDFGDKTFSDEKNPEHIYYVPGNYIVTLTVTNYSGESTYKGLITGLSESDCNFRRFPDRGHQ